MWDTLRTYRLRWRTLLASVGLTLLGSLQAFDAIDIRPAVSYFVGDEAATGAIMVFYALAMLALRTITNAPLLRKVEVSNKPVDEGN